MKRYALVVGIGTYQHIKDLSKPAADAQAVHDLLNEHGNFDNIQPLMDKQASKKGLEEALEQVLKPGDCSDVLIYFTGHGFTAGESDDEEQGYLATHDCEVEMEGDRAVIARRGLSFKRLNALIERANLSSLVMLLDCCHSEYFVQEALIQQKLSAFGRSGYFLSAACRSLQKAWANKNEAHSVYTGALLSALGDHNSGEVKVLAVHQAIETQLKGSGQEPIYCGYGGNLVLVDYRRSLPHPDIDESLEPYQGLNAFTPQTAQFFLGREDEVVDVMRKLEQSNFVAVVGPSGTGKSSVVRAGVVPRLTERGWQVLEPITPGPEPMAELKRAFREVFSEQEISQIYQQVEAGNLVNVVQQLTKRLQQKDQRVLLVIDQFEEVFTLGTAAAKAEKLVKQRRFIEPLLAVGALMDSALAIVVTMRSDFVDAWLATAQPPEMVQEQAVYVGPLQGEALKAAILEPAKKQQHDFEPGLLQLILRDVELVD